MLLFCTRDWFVLHIIWMRNDDTLCGLDTNNHSNVGFCWITADIDRIFFAVLLFHLEYLKQTETRHYYKIVYHIVRTRKFCCQCWNKNKIETKCLYVYDRVFGWMGTVLVSQTNGYVYVLHPLISTFTVNIEFCWKKVCKAFSKHSVLHIRWMIFLINEIKKSLFITNIDII